MNFFPPFVGAPLAACVLPSHFHMHTHTQCTLLVVLCYAMREYCFFLSHLFRPKRKIRCEKSVNKKSKKEKAKSFYSTTTTTTSNNEKLYSRHSHLTSSELCFSFYFHFCLVLKAWTRLARILPRESDRNQLIYALAKGTWYSTPPRMPASASASARERTQ